MVRCGMDITLAGYKWEVGGVRKVVLEAGWVTELTDWLYNFTLVLLSCLQKVKILNCRG